MVRGRAKVRVRNRVRTRARVRVGVRARVGVGVRVKVRVGVRVRFTSFMAMESRVTLALRTSCRTWLGLWVGVRGLSQVGDAHRQLLHACTTCPYSCLTSTSVAFISAIIVMT